MELCSGRKRVHSAASSETSGWTGEESDPDYRSGDEGGSRHSGSQSSTSEEVSDSSSDHLRGEMRSKKRHDVRREGQRVRDEGREGVMQKVGPSGRGKQVVGRGNGLEVKGKGKREEVKRRSRKEEGEDGGREVAVDIVIRHRYAFDAICALNDQLSNIQKEAVRGMVWSPVLEYKTFLMDQHMVHALLEAWNPESQCFKLGRREVPFSYFDVALLTRLLATRKRITFERSDGAREVEEVLKGAMEERVSRERQRWRTVQKDVRIYRNCVGLT